MFRTLAVAVALAAGAQARDEAAVAANPIRRVVSMLQMMQQKVQEEGKKEEALYEKFMCYCKTGSGDLTASIASAEAKTTQDTSSLEAAEALKSQLDKDLVDHKTDRAEAEDAVAQAKALRTKEAGVFASEDATAKTNIAALGKAIDAIEKGASGSFLQSSVASTVRRLTVDTDMGAADRDMLSSFLSGGQGYAPASGQITGILRQMQETMQKEHADLTATEQKAITDFEALVAAKEKEIEANSRAIESKTERVGQVGVDITNLKEDLDDTTKSLLADREFLANLDQDCATKTKEWEERSKVRTDELLALSETIKILNDDEALDLFKKTLPSASLLQTKVSSKAVRRNALAVLKAAGGGKLRDPRLDAVLLALTGHAKNFDKVLKMIDDMVALLGHEQQDDDNKKGYCESELDKTEDQQKVLDRTYDDLQAAIAEAEENLGTLGEEIKALIAGIKELDKSVADATELRQKENSEYKETMAADSAAKELIGVAKNRLAKFYSPGQYKEAPKRELSAEDRIFVNNGGTPPPTAAPGGIANTGVQASAAALVQISAHRGAEGDAPAPPPETWGAYQTKGQEHGGVIAMLDMLAADLDKEMQEMDVEEKEAQREYEEMMRDSAAKRAADAEAVLAKEGAKAELEGQIQKMHGEAKGTIAEAMAKGETLKDLHLECDWLMANFAARKEARAGEIDSLKQAKAILSGADFALVQTHARKLRGSK